MAIAVCISLNGASCQLPVASFQNVKSHWRLGTGNWPL
jgi:hypothetical protein